jgi:hypothetical protein
MPRSLYLLEIGSFTPDRAYVSRSHVLRARGSSVRKSASPRSGILGDMALVVQIGGVIKAVRLVVQVVVFVDIRQDPVADR